MRTDIERFLVGRFYNYVLENQHTSVSLLFSCFLVVSAIGLLYGEENSLMPPSNSSLVNHIQSPTLSTTIDEGKTKKVFHLLGESSFLSLLLCLIYFSNILGCSRLTAIVWTNWKVTISLSFGKILSNDYITGVCTFVYDKTFERMLYRIDLHFHTTHFIRFKCDVSGQC